MSRKIIGVTVGTTINPEKVLEKAGVKLPPVTEKDNGKIMIVENGAWGVGEMDSTLVVKDGVLSVNTADVAEADNTLPITSAAVHEQIGNIEILLQTI